MQLKQQDQQNHW